ncbi:MAG TPA: exodeoxyribonuclease VII small subunit [Candidatus Aphodoplasma excrementigallinarum]|uniref:Exodeoxyribonuclease 7 small subunit n=1 Tax=Candidatus Aphodoplasma excrementigallinarum TaxID=2840673 RepID=A0A9D1NG80_9FIRM|nr:exodeoxyribonuclease VII small subunit [Candidatus Aphodoplasma excrementigallinarum]
MSEKINFETNIKELEEIVAKLEKNDIPLDESLKLFERGVMLSAQCNKLLDEAEQKVNVLLKKDGEMVEQDFLMEDGE